jgi:diguanylate cyclase (GGDEF)-like protein
LAGADPAFAVRLLATVNSAAYRGANDVSDLTRAIGMLGIRGTRSIALGMVVSDLAPDDPDGDALLGNCVRRAIAARELAVAMGDRSGDDHFTTGLLLDAGLMTRGAGSLADAAEIGRSPTVERPIRERALGRRPHPEIGSLMAGRYRFPDDVVTAIARHHDHEMPPERLAAVAWAAERVAGVFEGGGAERNRELAVSAAAKLGLAEDTVQRILEEMPARVSEAAEAFNRDLGPQVDIESLINDARSELALMARQYQELIETLNRVLTEKESLASELQAANEALSAIATTDALTGLPNRRAFDEAILRDLARTTRQGGPLSLAVLDVDHFKMFNDTYGHAIGDDVLKVVGRTLAGCLRQGDVGARYGGEEFVLILPNTDTAGAKIAADRVREAVAAQIIETAKGKVGVTVSIGIATFVGGAGAEPIAPDSLFARADKGLYKAKEGGRNRVESI